MAVASQVRLSKSVVVSAYFAELATCIAAYREVPDGAKSTTACTTSLCVEYKIILPDFNLAVSTLTAKPPIF